MKMSRLLITIFLSYIVWIVISQYFFCPLFSFNTPKPFSGNALYNPYDSIAKEKWIKCNFHAHTNAWNGLTNGHGTANDIYHAYDSLGYGVYCVSEYQKINRALIARPGYIPAYEHGYGIKKTHQTVLGSDRVCWGDYLLPQTLSNKQHILNSISDNSTNVIIINHPSNRNGYESTDFKYLANFHCMEVLNPSALSFPQWDTALSFGKPVFIVGNDDLHNVFTGDRLGAMCTWVNVSSITERNVLNALKGGRSYGMVVGKSKDTLPILQRFEISNDTILIEMSKIASQITLIGQNGQILNSYKNTSTAQYTFKSSDHYARANIEYKNGTSIFLNPVFRHNRSDLNHVVAAVNIKKTFVFRLMGAIIIVIWMRIIFLFVFSKQTQKILLNPLFTNSRKLTSRLQYLFNRRAYLQN